MAMAEDEDEGWDVGPDSNVHHIVDLRSMREADRSPTGQLFIRTLQLQHQIASSPDKAPLKTLRFLCGGERTHGSAYHHRSLLRAPVRAVDPHTQLVDYGFQRQLQMRDTTCSWLAYALFHPHTRTSSWKKLRLHMHVKSDAVSVIKQMGKRDKTPLLSVTNLAVLMGLNQAKKHRTQGKPGGAIAPHLRIERGNNAQLLLANIRSGAVVSINPDSSSHCERNCALSRLPWIWSCAVSRLTCIAVFLSLTLAGLATRISWT